LKRFLIIVAAAALSLFGTQAYAHHDEHGHCEDTYDCGTYVCEETCEPEETEQCDYNHHEGEPWHCVSHKSGVYGCAQYVGITVCEGAEVYYTTDGTKPTRESKVYTKPIYIAENTVLRTAAYVDGERVESTKARIRVRTAVPTSSLPEGECESGAKAALSCADKGAKIYYTTDGSTPTSKSKRYTKPIAIKEDTTLKFAAYGENKLKSAVVTRKYTIAESAYSDPDRQELYELVNEVRARYGLAPLEENPELSRIAQQRAKECSAYFSHYRADGTKWSDLLKANGIKNTCRAENIAYYYETAEQALDSWLNDYAHRRNILDPDMKYIGVGYYNNGYCGYWTQLFIG